VTVLTILLVIVLILLLTGGGLGLRRRGLHGLWLQRHEDPPRALSG
jgi:hypothetical protein